MNRAVNQRVKSAIGMNEKINTDSRSIEREKADSTVRSPVGRIALGLFFATKLLPQGGLSAKVYQRVKSVALDLTYVEYSCNEQESGAFHGHGTKFSSGNPGGRS